VRYLSGSFLVVWEQVWLSWPEERLFRGLFGFNAAQGAAALSCLHSIIESVELPTGTTADLGTHFNPATYAVVRGGSTRVAVAAKAVRDAVETFVRNEVTTVPVSGLASDEEALLASRPRALAAEIESTYGVVVDFRTDDSLTLGVGTQVEVFGVASKPELNGQRGAVVNIDTCKDRYHVLLDAAPGYPPNKPFALPARSLRLLSRASGGDGSQNPQLLLEATENRTGVKVRALHGDLLYSGCGAIVNAANGRLAHGGGVAAAIATAAGPVCEAECRKAVRAAGGLLATGVAVPTGAGAVLNARGTMVVVHAVVPAWDTRDRGNAAVLLMRQAVRAALVEAEKAGAREVAIPLCGSGIYGWPAALAAEVVVSELMAYASNPACKLTRLDLVDFDGPKAAAAADALRALSGATSAAPGAASSVSLPRPQWYFYCKEISKRDDGFEPYGHDQNQQVEAAWLAYSKGRGPSQVSIMDDAGGVKSKSSYIPYGRTSPKYVICFSPRIEDSCQVNAVTKFARQLKHEERTEPSPEYRSRATEAARVSGNGSGSNSGSSGVGRFRITDDGREGSLTKSDGGNGGEASAAAARPSVSVRGFTQDARAGVSALVKTVRASKHEMELGVDDAKTPSHAYLLDRQGTASARHGATMELVPSMKQQRAVVDAHGDMNRDSNYAAAHGKSASVRDRKREDPRAPPAWGRATTPAAGESSTLSLPQTRPIDDDRDSREPNALRARSSGLNSGASGGGGGGSQKPQILHEATENRTGVKVRALHGDLLYSGCGAIVNAANGRLAHGGGVASAIATAAGPVCEAECRKAVRAAGGLLATGVAVPTGAGAVLNARGTMVVVHAVVPAWDTRDRGNAAVMLMRQAVRAALVEAEKAGACEVAIPLCGSGIYGWPASLAAEVVVSELMAYASNPATKLTRLDLVDFDGPKAAAAADALRALCGASSAAASTGASTAASTGAPMASTGSLPRPQWYFHCQASSTREDGFQPYDDDQNQQVEAAWLAYSKGRGPSEVAIMDDAGGVKSNSHNISRGKRAPTYVISFKPRIEDSYQINIVTRYARQLKREERTESSLLCGIQCVPARVDY
jgi:O-acetyl-ADP-ribose deacetylase (regulator of RNase III)